MRFCSDITDSSCVVRIVPTDDSAARGQTPCEKVACTLSPKAEQRIAFSVAAFLRPSPEELRSP